MSLGVGVVLIVLGAIVAFALDFNISGVEEYVLGWILILGGVLAIVLGLYQTSQSRRHHTTVEEHRYNDRT
jgi:uncharacterized membrane protein HdeD (DUF308 family)